MTYSVKAVVTWPMTLEVKTSINETTIYKHIFINVVIKMIFVTIQYHDIWSVIFLKHDNINNIYIKKMISLLFWSLVKIFY